MMKIIDKYVPSDDRVEISYTEFWLFYTVSEAYLYGKFCALYRFSDIIASDYLYKNI